VYTKMLADELPLWVTHEIPLLGSREAKLAPRSVFAIAIQITEAPWDGDARLVARFSAGLDAANASLGVEPLYFAVK
jgi:hypothetical protein